MKTNSLLHEIFKKNALFFREIKLESSREEIIKLEGNNFEENTFSNPYLKFFYEIGEMEEVQIYYHLDSNTQLLREIEVFFVSYPDYYWKKEGESDYLSFIQKMENKELEKYSVVFNATFDDLLHFCKNEFGEESEISHKDAAFSKPYHEFVKHSWVVENTYRLTIMKYVDDYDYNNIKNTFKIIVAIK